MPNPSRRDFLKRTAAAGSLADLILYAPAVLLLIVGFFLAQEKPARTMMLFGGAGAALMLFGLMTDGRVALYSFVAGGLFCSIIWPCIFALSIAGLGMYTNPNPQKRGGAARLRPLP